jgi:hypothetical protein
MQQKCALSIYLYLLSSQIVNIYFFNIYYCNIIVKYWSEFSFGTYRIEKIYAWHICAI